MLVEDLSPYTKYLKHRSPSASYVLVMVLMRMLLEAVGIGCSGGFCRGRLKLVNTVQKDIYYVKQFGTSGFIVLD